ncbi:MAG: SMC family ATPase [Acidimicrobiia bacterium]|nr:SMC family ATPase [Acidimicrobiia bacterium]
MRPVTLRLDGFRSYASEIEIDWTGRNLVGIVGPIGSGKSSILDAICLSLYGKTPTEKANQKSLIHQRADVGKVEFVFDVEGERWKSVRALRRTGQSAHALYRIDPDDPAGEPLETVLQKGPVDDRIEEILGVDFDGFNRSVMLAQGRFSDFLKATSTERDKVLKGVFGLDKVDVMESVAKRIRDEAKRDLEEFGRRKADLDNVKALAVRAGEVLVTSTERLNALAEREPIIESAETIRKAAQAEIDSAGKQTASLMELAERMPDSDESQKILKDHGAKISELVAAKARVREVGAAINAVRQERLEVLESVGGESELAMARQQVARLADARTGAERESLRSADAVAKVEAAGALVKKTVKEAEKLVAQATALVEKSTAAAASLQAAEDALHGARHAEMAATLRAGLVVDDNCPVCAQPVAAVPAPSKAGTALAKLEKARDKARSELAEVTAAEKAALAASAAATEGVNSAEKSLADIVVVAAEAKQASETASGLVEEIDKTLIAILGKKPVERLAEIEERLSGVDVRLQSLETDKKEADAAVEIGQKQVDEAEAALRNLTLTVSRLASQLAVQHEDLLEATDTEQLLASVREVWVEKQKQALDTREAAVARLAEATQLRAEAMEAVGFSPDDDFGKALSNAVAAVAAAQREVDVRNERLAQAADLDEQIIARQTVADLYDDLAKDLRPAAFLGYLLEEERAELGRVSSEQFEQLSGGRYRFSDDGDFNILDLNAAEQVRKSSTLSGGETFLASLALALALAEMVSRGSGRLDSFFLDEGFGSLDAEHLDLAMAGIESLVAGHEERLVVIVSHVPDMKDRIEDLLVLDKDPATGATIVVGA